MARIRTVSITAQNTFTSAIALSRGGIITLTGNWAATVSLQRYDKTSAGWVDVTSNSGTAVTYTGNGTFSIEPFEFEGKYRVGVKTGNFTSGTIVASIEGR
jgi:hypothetical protein